MVRINWSKQAVCDLQNIAEYISKDSKLYAKRQVIKIKSSTSILKYHMFSGRIVPEVNEHNIRELFEGNYRIIYKIVNDNRVDILTVHHSAKQFPLNI